MPISARSGHYVAWLGGLDDEISVLSQTFLLAGASEPLYLKFYYQIRSSDGCRYDFAEVRFDSFVIWEADLCSSEETNDWIGVSLNLSYFLGADMKLEFIVTTDYSVPSSFFIDDVTITRSP